MQLPRNEIGISDVLQHRDCGRRFGFGMRRHVELPRDLRWNEDEAENDDPPEAYNPNTAYGSAIHRAIELSEKEMLSDDAAVTQAMGEWGKFLDPEDLELLREDMKLYHERDYSGVTTVSVEEDMRFPLFEHEGETIWFRFKLDRLYRRVDNPAYFVSVDYKSSKWPKTDVEIHKDIQQWAYNLAVHEVYPECERLVQMYDQLRAGVVPTGKSPEQREQVRDFLIKRVKIVLADESLEPEYNEWCPYCPIMESCPVVERLGDWALTQILALAPQEKVGRKVVTQVDPDHIEDYLETWSKAKDAKKVLDRYIDSVTTLMKEMPQDERTARGFRLQRRKNTVFDTDGKRAAHEIMGDEFYEAVKLTKGELEDLYGKADKKEPNPMIEQILDHAIKQAGAVFLIDEREN